MRWAWVVSMTVACGRSGFGPAVDASRRDAGPADAFTTLDEFVDLFESISYAGSDGLRSWSTPWTEVGDDGAPDIATAHIFIESHVQNPTPDTLALKIKVDGSGYYVFRELNLAAATEAHLRYAFHNELQSPGTVDVQVSANAGGDWTTLQSYADADTFGSEEIDITPYASAATQIRLIATAAGGRHFRIDDVAIRAIP